MIDFAPDIYRQRMIIEGVKVDPISDNKIKECLTTLCTDLDMVKLTDPEVHHCEEYGTCGFMHWKTSGVHIYVWNKRDPVFFSVDIYTCKEFDPFDALLSVEQSLQPRTTTWKNI